MRKQDEVETRLNETIEAKKKCLSNATGADEYQRLHAEERILRWMLNETGNYPAGEY